MSLINDALKKARQAQSATSATAAGPALRPVDVIRPPRHPLLTVRFAVVLVLVLVLAGVLFVQWFHGARSTVQARAKTPVASAPAPIPGPAPVESNSTPADAATAAQPAPTPTVAAATPLPAETNTVPETVAVAPPPPPDDPPLTLKLQGIFYNPRQPGAIINGRTVYVGGHVDDARIVSIDRRTVTVALPSGHTHVLELENQY